MAISGTVPRFDISTSAEQSPTVVTVTGLEADGQATGDDSNETLQAFLQRVVTALSLSGTIGVDPADFQCVSASVLSGVMQIQRECAMRCADIVKGSEQDNAARLAYARSVLTAGGGEVQFGS